MHSEHLYTVVLTVSIARSVSKTAKLTQTSLTTHHTKHSFQFLKPYWPDTYPFSPLVWVLPLLATSFTVRSSSTLSLSLCLTLQKRSHEGGSHLKVQPNVSNGGRDVPKEERLLSRSLSNTSFSPGLFSLTSPQMQPLLFVWFLETGGQ